MGFKVSRNESCPCGSGKKYKSCCAGRDARSGGRFGKFLVAVVVAAMLAGIVVLIGTIRDTDLSVEGFVYDAVNDRYFDSSPGHNHWNNGRPPGQASGTPAIDLDGAVRNRAVPDAGLAPITAPAAVPADVSAPRGDESPSAWQYDAESDRHWNPEIAGWEQGMPPLEAFTSESN